MLIRAATLEFRTSRSGKLPDFGRTLRTAPGRRHAGHLGSRDRVIEPCSEFSAGGWSRWSIAVRLPALILLFGQAWKTPPGVQVKELKLPGNGVLDSFRTIHCGGVLGVQINRSVADDNVRAMTSRVPLFVEQIIPYCPRAAFPEGFRAQM